MGDVIPRFETELTFATTVGGTTGEREGPSCIDLRRGGSYSRELIGVLSMDDSVRSAASASAALTIWQTDQPGAAAAMQLSFCPVVNPTIWVHLLAGRRVTKMIGSFSFVVPIWVLIPVLLLLVLGGMKLVKLLLMALKG